VCAAPRPPSEPRRRCAGRGTAGGHGGRASPRHQGAARLAEHARCSRGPVRAGRSRWRPAPTDRRATAGGAPDDGRSSTLILNREHALIVPPASDVLPRPGPAGTRPGRAAAGAIIPGPVCPVILVSVVAERFCAIGPLHGTYSSVLRGFLPPAVVVAPPGLARKGADLQAENN
jgi:hypothetical protein